VCAVFPGGMRAFVVCATAPTLTTVRKKRMFPLHRSGRVCSVSASMRAALLAATAAALLAVVLAAPASGGSSPWAVYLAPAPSCPGSNLTVAAADVEKRAMTCLINWTRRRAGLRSLRWSKTLANAAGSKADIIVACNDFSHHACGSRWPAEAARQHRYDIWGENLYYGVRAISTPRRALLAWLESPEHRALLFGRPWRDLGLMYRVVPSLRGSHRVAIWVLEVAGRT
jgi:uncharacterized protein YkwD